MWYNSSTTCSRNSDRKILFLFFSFEFSNGIFLADLFCGTCGKKNFWITVLKRKISAEKRSLDKIGSFCNRRSQNVETESEISIGISDFYVCCVNIFEIAG